MDQQTPDYIYKMTDEIRKEDRGENLFKHCLKERKAVKGDSRRLKEMLEHYKECRYSQEGIK